MSWVRKFFEFIGRLSIAAIFVLFGIYKAFHWDFVIQEMTKQGITQYTELLAACAIILEVVVGFALFFGYCKRTAAILLALYLIPVTYFFHPFWAATEQQEMQLQTINFFKNLAIFGGLICLAASPQQDQPKGK